MLTHIDKNNNPSMVDVSHKTQTQRIAVAKGTVFLGKEIMTQLSHNDITTKKGPVFSTAIIAATMGVKKTSDIIPFCHPINIENIKIEIIPMDDSNIEITSTVSCFGKTGVEMEALTGVHIAALTIHDMCKSMSQKIKVDQIHLVKKTGGKTDYSVGENEN